MTVFPVMPDPTETLARIDDLDQSFVHSGDSGVLPVCHRDMI